MAFDPSIIMGYKGMGDVPNPLAQMAQVSQVQASQRQNEIAQMQLEDLKNDRIEMQKFQAELVANGGNPDLKVLAQTMLRSPKTRAEGIELMQKLNQQTQFEAVGKKLYPELFGAEPTVAEPTAAAPAPSIMRQPGVAPAVPVAPNALGTGMYGMEPTAPVNALMPTAAPTAAAPVNALAAPTGKTVDQLRREIIMFSQSTDPRAKAMVDMLKNQLTELGKTQTLGPGQQLYAGGKVIYTAPEKETDLQRNYKFAQTAAGGNFKGSFADFKVLSTPKTTTNITNVQEKAEAGERGKMLVDQYKDISKSAGLAVKTLPAIEANLSALNKGFDTGFGKETVAAGASVLAALGVKNAEKFATDTQTFQSNAISAVLQKQLEQKGPQTEFDARRIETLGAQLGKTKQANEFILATAKEQLQRDIEQRNFYDRWYKTNKTYDGAEDAWFTGEGGKSLFDRPGLKKYAVSAAPAASTETPAAANKPSLDSIFKTKRP